MSTETTTTPLTPAQILEAVKAEAKEKAELLSTSLRRKVIPIVLRKLGTTDEYIKGFAYKPDLVTQCRLIDKSAGSENGINMEVAVEVIGSLLITAECDKELTDESGDRYDVYTKGAAFTLKLYMGTAVPVFF